MGYEQLRDKRLLCEIGELETNSPIFQSFGMQTTLCNNASLCARRPPTDARKCILNIWGKFGTSEGGTAQTTTSLVKSLHAVNAETKPWRVKDNPCNGNFGADVIEGFADTTCELPHVAIGLGDVASLLAIMRGSQTNQGSKFRVRNCQVSGMNTVDARLGASRAVVCFFIGFKRCGLLFRFGGCGLLF